MSLYFCTKCHTVENTATGGYWLQQMAAIENPHVEFKPLCSACNPEIGEWHGQFPREKVTADWLQDRRGFIWRAHQTETVKHLGPFKPVQL